VRPGLSYEVRPEPEPDEAAALAVALDAVLAGDPALAGPPHRRSRWRAAGLAELTAPGPEPR
jgi:hypothetical protein